MALYHATWPGKLGDLDDLDGPKESTVHSLQKNHDDRQQCKTPRQSQ